MFRGIHFISFCLYNVYFTERGMTDEQLISHRKRFKIRRYNITSGFRNIGSLHFNHLCMVPNDVCYHTIFPPGNCAQLCFLFIPFLVCQCLFSEETYFFHSTIIATLGMFTLFLSLRSTETLSKSVCLANENML